MTTTTPSAAPPSPGRTSRFAPFALGFRPLYALAAPMAIAGVAVWMLQWFGLVPIGGTIAGADWHAHEMVFGFAAAVIAGFLFTATRNWTGLPTPAGRTLGALCLTWLAARVALVVAPWPVAAILDVGFLPAVAAALWGPLQRTRNRNRFMVGILLALAMANGVFHLAAQGLVPVAPGGAVRFALYAIVMLVAIMGGRVIPSFTANALPGAHVRTRPAVDRTALVLSGVALALLLGLPGHGATAVACVAAAVAQAVRLAGWHPAATRRTPILWILHVSYAWIPVAFALHAAHAWGLSVPRALADHALGVGAIGGVILGMVTRTARGHTGRPLQTGRLETIAYALVHAAAALRVLVPIIQPEALRLAVGGAAALWSLAFALYLVVYLPILIRPRADGKPG